MCRATNWIILHLPSAPLNAAFNPERLLAYPQTTRITFASDRRATTFQPRQGSAMLSRIQPLQGDAPWMM
jgi:hypothetical protein